MKISYFVVFLLSIATAAVLARQRRRGGIRRRLSYNYNKLMEGLDFEKAKVETLGAIFKRHVQQLRNTPNKQVELVFLIDSSGSVGSHYFYQEVRFVKNLLADFTVDVNTTRVSVITFSSPHKIFRHIDYMSQPSSENHKCRLLQEDIPDVDYTAGGTNTRGAFLEAEKVLRSARSDATKAIFLMTDGYSNGGDPLPVAQKLKARNVQIFTFGIRDGNVWELKDMASEPKNETCYILDSFEEFDALAKRALHTDLQSGTYVGQSLSKCGGLCNDMEGACCNENAICSCGTYTGKYECLCNAGYYGAGVGKTGCKPCPPGSYKNYTGLGGCTSCPDKHQVTPLAATSISLCKCKKGYRSFGSEECKVFRCPKLSPPKHGFFVNNKCNNVFNAACGLKCNSGYELRGSSLRICQEDGQWSGQQPECILKTCPSLPQPKNGHMICSSDDFSYSTVCRFTCNTGYHLVGSRKRTCLAIAFWTGIATRCREITCPPLVEIKDGTVSPPSCTSSEVVFGTSCQTSCRSGYTLKGPHSKQCTPDGTWLASEKGVNLCIDESPPILHCPNNIQVSASEEDSLTPVDWSEPVPVDNSGLRPVLTAEPSVSPGSNFPIGKTTVTYRAKDLSSNVANCQFVIEVLDKTPPRVDKCLSPAPIVSNTRMAAIDIEEPQFSDNSGKPVEVAPSRRLHDLFSMGKTQITFTAFDSTNNNSTCVIEVIIVSRLCTIPKPPANGNITCDEGDQEMDCRISCMEGFTFADETQTEYKCQFDDGVWTPKEHFPFQDCSAVQETNDILQPGSITLTSDVSCKDRRILSEVVQNIELEMKNELKEACDKELSCTLGGFSFLCEDDANYNKVPQIVSRKRRRMRRSPLDNEDGIKEDSDKSKLSLHFTLTGSLSQDEGLREKLETHLRDAMTTMFQSMKDRKNQTLDVNGKSVGIKEMSYNINDPKYKCEPGSIVLNKTCVTCPAGTYGSLDQIMCKKCPKGTYQDKKNQTTCIRCPNDKSTESDNSRSEKECKALCKPGSFSMSGLEPCETCHHGFYQSDYASRRCKSCGEGRTTLRRGSVSEDNCADLCPPGHASRTGLVPCYPCPSSGYQPKLGQIECLRCPQGGNTNQTGAVYSSQCPTYSDYWEMQADDSSAHQAIPFTTCAFENPCNNGGTCKPEEGSLFTCICPSEFSGKTCDVKVDPCKSDPCLNNGLCLIDHVLYTCLCLGGFSGRSCEVNIDECENQPCQNNGICVDGIDSFSCNCQPGFSGSTCEVFSENCDNQPCLNGGSCSIADTGVNCTCIPGFSGELCEQNVDECLEFPCQNDATCVDLLDDYSCICIVGYTGKRCEDDINECDLYQPCTNGGQCVDGLGYYTCTCPDGFSGKKCEEVLSPYYQLEFANPGILDYAEMTINEPLTAITASFWMKTIDDDNQGTPFSYAVKEQPDAFTITDYKSLNIYINGEDVSVDLRLNDGFWQHVVFTWSSPRGDWKIYQNGLLIDQGYDLSTRKAIPGNGTFIIGQEQDEEGGGFSSGETFLGSLTQLNLWDRELSLNEIEKLRFSCEGFHGNVIGWPKVQSFLRGNLIRSTSKFCNDCPKPEAPSNGFVAFTGVRPNDDVFYNCSVGYNTAGRSEFKCLVSGVWEATSPNCQPVFCGHPGSPLNGFVIGKNFSYGGRVRFRCNRGYEIDGPESVLCTEWEEWDDDLPDCVEIQCEIPLLSTNTIASVPSQFVNPGTVVEFSCTLGNKMLSDHNSSLCQIDGIFDKSVPTCDPERCPSSPVIDYGFPKELKEDYGVGETVQYECTYGYRLNPEVGNRKGTINCLPTGDWEDNLPECEEITCPNPPSVPNAKYVGERRTVDSEVIYECNPGYKSVSKSVLTCQLIGEWSRLRMRCRPIDCGSPPPIPNGSFIGNLFIFGSTISYQCDQGYNIEGNQDRSCQTDGNWNGESPSCLPVSCGQPEIIENGQVNFKDTTYSEKATYSCYTGYILSGDSTLTCESSKSWKPNPPSCDPKPCPVPPDVADATYQSPPQLVFNTSVVYTCNTGHILTGSSVLLCNHDAVWTPTPPACDKIKCPKLLSPDSGSVSVKDLTYSSIATYFCDENFKLVGAAARTCQGDGTWSDKMPNCQATKCQAPRYPANGRIDFKDLSIGSIVSYSCNKGYELIGNSIRRCQVDLTLDGVSPVCIPMDCGQILPLKNGAISLSGPTTFFGTTATLACDNGYFLAGSETIECGPDGKWSDPNPECKPVECPKVSKILLNGGVTGSSFTYKSVLSYSCNEGYKLDGLANRTCRSDKTWDNPAPSCKIIRCPRPRLVYGVVSTFSDTFGTTVKYSCTGSYRLQGPSNRTCLASGKWSGEDPKCLKINCVAPSNVEHAESRAINETAIEYSCHKGYHLVGNAIRVCDKDEVWRPDPPKCEPSFCRDLSHEILLNGKVLFSSAKVGQKVEYTCNTGYQIKGDKSRRCLALGKWEGNDPVCEKVDCGHPGILPNGHIIGSDYTFNATVSFECDIGYKLEGVKNIRCLETTYWENYFPLCERVKCPEPTSFEHGEVYFDSNSYLSYAEYVCNKGFILNGPEERECLATGEWSDDDPVCVPATCPEPEFVKNGILFGAKAVYRHDDEIYYECTEGYYMNGKSTRVCTKEAKWTDWIPRCSGIRCPEPPFMENGYFEGRSAKYKAVLKFFCELGYDLIGESEMHCQADGSWSASNPHCERSSCGAPNIIENTYIDQSSNFTYGANVIYSCNDGYTPSGNSLILCLANKTWSYVDFTCTIISCPPINSLDVSHGLFQASTFSYQSQVEFSCEEGYRLSGERIIECQSSGLWSSPLPICNIILCPALETISYGSVNVDSLEYGSVAIPKCDAGYNIKGSSSIICLSSGNWNDSLPFCEIVTCINPPEVLNGVLLTPEGPHVFGYRAVYSCNYGYELQGSNILRCTAAGIYNTQPPICERITCPKIEDISFGKYKWVNGTYVLYSCDSGFFIVGNDFRHCELGGIWGSAPPVCKPVPCPTPLGIGNGEVIGTLFSFGNFVEYRCNVGHNLIGAPISVCQEDGTWSEKNAQCLPINCDEPEDNFENGYIKSNLYTYQQTIEYVCSSGFELKGNKVRTCRQDGAWSGKVPSCVRLSCGEPDPISNGKISGKNYFFGSVISYECFDGYFISGNNTRACESSLKWSSSNPTCALSSCPPPQNIVNGYITGSSYLYGNSIQIACNEGFKLEGSETRTCDASQSWSGVDAICKRIYCPVPPILENAFSDYELGTVYSVGSVVTYFCSRGYLMNGSGQRTCESSGQWSSNVLVCYLNTCPAVNSIDNGVITANPSDSPFTYRSVLTFTCNQGFYLVGSSSTKCGAFGEWNEDIPSCSIIPCEILSVENGFVELISNSGLTAKFKRHEGRYYAGDNVKIQCNLGYEVASISNTSCSVRGKWMSENVSCRRVQCPDPVVENGVVSGDSYFYGDTIQITCNGGFELEGSETRTCDASQSWSGVDAVCKRIYCPVPPILDNAFSDYELGTVYSVGSVVTYFCSRGYLMNGSGQRTCESSGQWSSNLLVCYLNTCPAVNSIDNGVITANPSDSPFTYRSVLTFTCHQGFYLVGSSSTKCGAFGEWNEDIPSCSIIPCEILPVENGFIELTPNSGLGVKFNRQEGRYYAGDNVKIKCNLGYEVASIFNTSCSLRGKWMSENVSCRRVQCPVPVVENGVVSGDSYFYGDTIQIACNRGFELEGSETRTCKASQSWSGVDAICRRIYCPTPPGLRSGFNDYETNNVYGVDSVVTYFCSLGYLIKGSSQRVCEASGQWSSNVLECYLNSCPEVNSLRNGVITFDSPDSPFTYQSSLFFTCNKGFNLIGSSSIECGASRKWNEAIPKCYIIQCERLEVENGFTELNLDSGLIPLFLREEGKYYAGDNVKIQCNLGYEVASISNTSCSLRGKWMSENVSCRRVQCPVPVVENGVVSGDSYFYGDTIQIACNGGFELEGSETRTCDASQSWSGVDAICKRIYCPVPPILENAFSDYELGTVYSVGSVVTYFCSRGYLMNGSGQRTCESSGQWSSNLLDCYLNTCPAVNSIDNGVITANPSDSPFTYRSVLTFTCHQGFYLVGSSSTKCGAFGEWNEDIPKCSIIQCERLNVKYGFLELITQSGFETSFIREEGRHYAGDVIGIICNAGYEINGDSNSVCSLTGSWTSKVTCIPVICLAPQINDAQFTHLSETYKNKISVSCNEGLDLIGDDELTCGSDKTWEEELPRCELLACGSPNKVKNAVLKGESFKPGDTVMYVCKTGYELIGNNILTCGPTNEWLGSYPLCMAIDCGPPEVIPDAYISVNATTFQATATVHCLPGYEIDDNNVIVCGADHHWIVDPSTQCIPIDCGNPPVITHGSVFPDDTIYGSLAVYTCNVGHVIEGSSSMYCDEDGQWGYQIPICSPVSCFSDPPNVSNAWYTKNGSSYLDVVKYQCERGYKFTDSTVTSLVCGDMGTWKEKAPSCTIINCGAPPFIANAFSALSKHDTTYLNKATYTCLPGYESSTITILTCGDKSQWEGNVSRCMKKDCLTYPTLSNGKYSQGNGTQFGSEVFYECLKGYEKTGSDVIQCTSEGKWTDPYCSALDCFEPPPLPYGYYTFDSTTYQSEVKYSCNSGYVLAGTSTSECLDTGLWSPVSGKCKPLNCHDPPRVDNATVTYNTTVYKDIVIYSCDVGYTSSTSMSLLCDEQGKWSGTVPKCEAITCHVPEVPANGFLNSTGITYLSKSVFECQSGYQMIGQKRITCLENGTWSNDIPSCSRIECSELFDIDNGKVVSPGTYFGANTTYHCLDGYIMEGKAILFCNEKGLWSSPAPYCRIVDCRVPPTLEHGLVQYNATTFKSNAIFSCKKGYTLSGSQNIQCQGNGIWSNYDEKRECKFIVCPEPPPLENGMLVSYNITFGSRAVYRCLPYYKPQVLSIMTCGKSGAWQGQLVHCHLKSCNPPGPINHGLLLYNKPALIGSVVEYICDEGYNLIGQNKITCLAEEVWSPNPPHCKPATCPVLSLVPFSIVKQEEKAQYKSVAVFQCHEGYSMFIHNEYSATEIRYICNEKGQWEGDSFQCDPIICPLDPPPVEHATYSLTNGNSFQSRVLYDCVPGFIAVSDSNVFCDKTGHWTALQVPSCKIISCEIPPFVQGASYEVNHFTYGTAVTYHCRQHHRLVGDNTIECLSDGSWTTAAFACEIIHCNLVAVPKNGMILDDHEDTFVVGSIVHFVCNEGYALTGSKSIKCQESGLWNSSSPYCEKVIGVCEESIPMEHALSPPPGKFPGDEINVDCVSGYVGHGDMMSRCQNNGSWPIPAGICSRISCGKPDVQGRHIVRIFGRSYLYGDTVRFMCHYRYSPMQNPPILKCLSSGEWEKNEGCQAQCKHTCLNGGRCLGLNRCKCMPGWAGFKCHVPLCIFPCLNGGQCAGPYKCRCPSGYGGSRCQRAICPRPCQNGGRCLRRGKCLCRSGYFGETCENKMLS